MSTLLILLAGLTFPTISALSYLVIRHMWRNETREAFEEEDGWTP